MKDLVALGDALQGPAPDRAVPRSDARGGRLPASGTASRSSVTSSTAKVAVGIRRSTGSTATRPETTTSRSCCWKARWLRFGGTHEISRAVEEPVADDGDIDTLVPADGGCAGRAHRAGAWRRALGDSDARASPHDASSRAER
jgi:hypothetical protein